MHINNNNKIIIYFKIYQNIYIYIFILSKKKYIYLNNTELIDYTHVENSILVLNFFIIFSSKIYFINKKKF